MIFKDKLDVLKDLSRNSRDYTVEIEFTDLTLSQPMTWGYFRRDAYYEFDGDCELVSRLRRSGLDTNVPQSRYFVTKTAVDTKEATKIPEIVSAELPSLRVIDKAGKVIGGYKLPKVALKELTLDLGDKVTLKLVQIPGGKFLMDSPQDEKDPDDDKGLPPDKWVNGEPWFEVTISKPFYLGVYEVTVAQYAQFLKDTGQKHKEPSLKQTGDHPVVDASWDDAQAFCAWLSKKTGKTVALPTEAQWEYACRAGSKTLFSFGDRYEDLHKYGNYCDKSNTNGLPWQDKEHSDGFDRTAPVGSLKPNAWGLYDMHGNAWEWCADWYSAYTGAGTDPTGPKDGSLRVLRGGSWNNNPRNCRSANRNRNNPDNRNDNNGFRVAVPLWPVHTRDERGGQVCS